MAKTVSNLCQPTMPSCRSRVIAFDNFTRLCSSGHLDRRIGCPCSQPFPRVFHNHDMEKATLGSRLVLVPSTPQDHLVDHAAAGKAPETNHCLVEIDASSSATFFHSRYCAIGARSQRASNHAFKCGGPPLLHDFSSIILTLVSLLQRHFRERLLEFCAHFDYEKLQSCAPTYYRSCN